MRKVRKVLVVEREKAWENLYQIQLAELGFELLFATTAEEGERLFDGHHSTIFAASIGSKITGVAKLIKQMRSINPSLPIFAASVIPEFRQELIIMGCDRELELSDKRELAMRLMKLPNAVVPVQANSS